MYGKRRELLALFVTCAVCVLSEVASAAPNPPFPDARNIRVQVMSPTEAAVTWTTAKPTRSKVEFCGVVPPFDRRRDVSDYVQAVIYAPEVHGDALSADLIDRDLLAIEAANANAINLYGLSSDALKKHLRGVRGLTMEEYLLSRCRQMDLKVIARLEWYPPGFSFLCGDADAVLRYYAESIELFRSRFRHVLLYYLVNMPMDDPRVQQQFGGAFNYPSAHQQRDYVGYIRRRISDMDPGGKVRVVAHWGSMNEIPVAPYADIVDGVALVAYPVRCGAAPFMSGLPVVDCSKKPCIDIPYCGPSLSDPANVVIGKDQIDYYLDKTKCVNSLANSSGLAMDGVGFAERLGHWSGVVADHTTKVQAVKWLADYLGDEDRTDGYSYFMLYDKDEGSFGILVPSRTVEETRPVRQHRVVLTALSPGAKYKVRIIRVGNHTDSVTFATPDPCPGADWPRITLKTPEYCGEIATNPSSYEVSWTSNLPVGTEVTVFADSDERGLDGTQVGQGTVGHDGSGSASVDLSSLPQRAYYLYCVAQASHCSVPGSKVWDYSSGRVVIATGVIEARKRPAGQTITVDGTLNAAWDAAPWTLFATHPADNGGSTARIKMLWDNDNLFAAFDVSDTQVETNAEPNTWDSDSISLLLSFGMSPVGCPDPSWCVREYRQGPCAGGSSMPGIETAWLLKPGTTCNNATDTDAGYWVEMRIPRKDLGVVLCPGFVILADLLSVDHDNNPGGQYNVSPTVFSKIFWDGDGPDHVRGAIRLVD